MISVFDIFKIGIGPSSSHTVGPMWATVHFADLCDEATDKVTVELFGSLALTGIGHGTDRAVILGLSGYCPDTVTSDEITNTLEAVSQNKKLTLNKKTPINFDPDQHIVFHKKEFLKKHPNGMRLTAYKGEEILLQDNYYSVGGGFVNCDSQGDLHFGDSAQGEAHRHDVPRVRQRIPNQSKPGSRAAARCDI